MLSRD